MLRPATGQMYLLPPGSGATGWLSVAALRYWLSTQPLRPLYETWAQRPSGEREITVRRVFSGITARMRWSMPGPARRLTPSGEFTRITCAAGDGLGTGVGAGCAVGVGDGDAPAARTPTKSSTT